MLNKKSLSTSVEVLIATVSMLVLGAILIWFDTTAAEVMVGGAEDKLCFLDVAATHLSKVGPISLSDLRLCPIKWIYVMMDPKDVPFNERKKGVEYVYINKPISKKLKEDLTKWYGEDFESKDQVLLYRLNEIMANELKRCWGNLGRGNYDLFSEDFINIEYKEGTFKSTDGLFKNIGKSLQVWDLRLEDNPKVCKRCSIISFHDTVQKHFKGEEIDLKPFLKNNPVTLKTPESISYYQFLDDNIKLKSDYLRPNYIYTVTEKEQAVVFLRANLKSYAGKIMSKTGTGDLREIFSDEDYTEDGTILAMDFPLLIPHEEVSISCDDWD